MKSTAICTFALLLSVSTQLTSQQPLTRTIEESILNGLREARPDLEIGQPVPSPVEGYYQVPISADQTIYVSADGKHFFAGELYFAEPGRFINATEMARAKRRLEVLAGIDKTEMIIFAPEEGTKAVMTVFTDATCGFCRKLHDQMAAMNALGIEVRYMAYPRSGIKREGEYTHEYELTSKAWCADDRKSAMTAVKAGLAVDVETCDEPIISKHYQIGVDFGVNGTPAIILPDGSLLPGYRSPSEYARILGIETDS